ncbi:hypothetical protein Tco_1083174 [Tanacetum coccineum]|uniref:Uncharacterized protein n=1 Tax=Tanacetum coccineum TaxID=301880 RepID=A0ABQ5I2K6_9ASTR
MIVVYTAITKEYDSWVNDRQIQTTEIQRAGYETADRDDAHADDADIRPIYDDEPMIITNQYEMRTTPLMSVQHSAVVVVEPNNIRMAMDDSAWWKQCG